MLGKIITFKRKLGFVGGRLILCSLSNDILQVFHITKLDKYVQIAPSVSDALPVLGSREIAIACSWHDCAHEIVLPLVTFIDAGYRARCPACETEYALLLTEGLEGNEARIARLEVAMFEKQSLRVATSIGHDRLPTGPFHVQMPGVCEVLVADAIERLMRTLPAPRQVILQVSGLKELTPKAAGRLESIVQNLLPGEVFVAQYKVSNDPPPFDWPPSIPLFATPQEAQEICAAAGSPQPLTVPLRHL
jgi:hypothetical protein